MGKSRAGYTREITLWNKGPQYIQKHDGFGHTFDLKACVERGIGYIPSYEAGTEVNVLREAGDLIPGLRLLEFPDGGVSLISTPYRHIWPTQAKTHWTLSPDAASWDAYEGDFGECVLDYAWSDDTSFAEAESVFTLPPDPWFAIRLQRGEPNEDWPTTELPYTRIDFGQEYRIVIPYGGPVRLYVSGVSSWLELKPESGEGLSGFEGLDHNDARFICVGVLRGYILLSDDLFGNSIAFYRIPVGDDYRSEGLELQPRYWTDPEETNYPRVWSWNVKVGHNAGDFGFTYYPVWPVRHNTPAGNEPYLRTYFQDFDYKHSENPVAIASDAWIETRKPAWDTLTEFRVIEDDAIVTVAPSIVVSALTGYTAYMRAGWDPAMWTSVYGPGADYYSHLVAPAVHQMQMWQPAWIGSAAGTSVVLSRGWAGRLSLEYLETGCEEEFGPMWARMKFVEGANAYTCRLLQPFRRIRVKLGTKYASGATTTFDTATVFDGYIATPGLSTLRGLHDDIARGEWQAFCDAKRLTDAKAHQREPDLGLFSVSAAATWLWGRAGVPSAHVSFGADRAGALWHILHGLSCTVDGINRTYEGAAVDDRWKLEAGTELLPVLRDIARAADNSQWYCDPATRTYKLTDGWWLGNTSHLIREGPLAHQSGAYGVYEFNVETRSFDSEEFANRVTLVGRDADGNTLWATRRDTSSAWNSSAANYAGRWIDHVETRDDLRTRADLEAAADSTLAALSEKSHRATITTDPIVNLRRGHLLKTSGGTNGAFDLYSCVNAKWLVTGYTHSWNKADGPMGARTIAQLRWWGY